MVLSSDYKTFQVIDLRTFKVVKTIAIKEEFSKIVFKTWGNYALAILDNGQILFINDSSYEIDKVIKLPKMSLNFVEVYEHYVLLGDNGHINLVDLNNGEKIYSRYISAYRGYIKIYDGYLIFNKNLKYNVHVHDLVSFKEIWKYEKHTAEHGTAVFGVNNGKVYFNDRYQTKVFELETGRIVSKVEQEVNNFIFTQNQDISFERFENQSNIVSKDILDKIVWQCHLTGPYYYFNQDFIYFFSNDAESLTKLNLLTGKAMWTNDSFDFEIVKIESYGKYDVIESLGKNIYVTENGKLLWKHKVFETVDSKREWLHRNNAQDDTTALWFIQNNQLYLYDGTHFKSYEL